ncbi:MAG: hypothetical protein AAF171_00185 [Cyanobacteria bacterium P01_A01_bin.116]
MFQVTLPAIAASNHKFNILFEGQDPAKDKATVLSARFALDELS